MVQEGSQFVLQMLQFVFQLALLAKQRMSNSEKLCLKWNDFQENLHSAFAVLRNDQDLADVTLVCEDGTFKGRSFLL